MSFNGIKITGPAAAAAVLCFFMPWVLVSCNNQPVASFSGWQLAAGGVVDSALGPMPLSGSPSIFLILLAALGALGLAFAIHRGTLDLRRATFGWIGLGTLSLLLLVFKFVGADSQASQQAGANIHVDLRFGYWGSFVSNIALIGGAIRELRGLSRPAPALTGLPSDPLAPDAVPVSVGDQVACTSCGTANVAGSRFCTSCGTTLPSAV
jgi:zinc-ribbon domain